MNRSFGKITVVLLVIVSCVMAGCQEPVVEVDPADLNLVDHYVEELTLALLDLEPDLMGWVREPYAENFPLKYNEERIAFLVGHQRKINQIRETRQTESFPSAVLMAQWQVIVVRGSDEWFLEGPAIVDALDRLEELSDRVEQSLNLIIDSDGILDLEQSEIVLNLTEELTPTVEVIRAVFYQ